jgi:hypothetical protein
MKTVISVLLLLAAPLTAQAPQGEPKTPKPYSPPPLFTSAQPLEFTLIAPFKQLKKNRRGDEKPYQVAEVMYAGDSGTVRVPVRVRVRGIWRRQNCELPPLRLNFNKDSAKKSTFAKLDKVRLVMHCRNGDDFDQYVLQEFQLYRVHRLITPLSFDVRLARVTYIDAEKKDSLTRRYAFLLEEDDDFGPRVGGKALKTTGATGADLDPFENALFGVWQYFIGNTDFSVAALHNVVLFSRDTSYFPVAFDYDWSGAVNSRYARPNPILKDIRAVTDRLMRGYCAPEAEYLKAFALFREKKDAIYALYRDSLAAPMKPNVVNNTLKYFDDFYKVINNPRDAKRQIIDACLRGPA